MSMRIEALVKAPPDIQQLSLPVAPGLVAGELSLHGGDHAYLRLGRKPDAVDGRHVSLVDLFAGCGGLTLGVEEACRAAGLSLTVEAAVEIEPHAAAVYEKNFQPKRMSNADVGTIFSTDFDAPINRGERELMLDIPHLSFLVGGPPCQGHSDLNNYSRRSDPKNGLYGVMARAARVLQPEHVIIENVPSSLHDRSGVVQKTIGRLEAIGYCVAAAVVSLARIGVPQQRRRLVVVASRQRYPLSTLDVRYATPLRDVAWAIGDLEGSADDACELRDMPAKSAPETLRRIRYLFENGLYDLPDGERPPCHRDRSHTYKSIYGRLRWDMPSQTITRGFYSMCMGRYVHPSRERTLTAHEAARLQFFPDYFDFSVISGRNDLASVIGNAVPMKLSFLIAKDLLGKGLS